MESICIYKKDDTVYLISNLKQTFSNNLKYYAGDGIKYNDCIALGVQGFDLQTQTLDFVNPESIIENCTRTNITSKFVPELIENLKYFKVLKHNKDDDICYMSMDILCTNGDKMYFINHDFCVNEIITFRAIGEGDAELNTLLAGIDENKDIISEFKRVFKLMNKIYDFGSSVEIYNFKTKKFKRLEF